MAKQSKTSPDLTLLPMRRADPQPNDAVTFRPGPEMSGVIASFAAKHKLPGKKISRSELCNRLVCLALARFDVELHYLLVSELAQFVGGRNSFANTCFQILQVVAYNEKHLDKPLPPDLPTLVISSLLEAEKARMETEIPADTEVEAVTSKD